MSKYDKYRNLDLDKFQEIEIPESEIDSFDWFGFTSTAPKVPIMPEYISIIDIKKETTEERKIRMLRQLSRTCTACSMCELGMKGAEKYNEIRDPHVFSNMKISRFMIVGQNPGWDELKQGVPFVGMAGKNFDAEIEKHGITRDDFYISNSVRCYTQNNQRPTQRHMDRCEPFLKMEIGILKPKLVITLGAVAFAQFCPELKYSDSLKHITKSKKFGVPVFAVYHPSPLNFAEKHRKREFAKQIKLLCAVMRKIDK